MASQREMDEYVRRRPLALALCSVTFILLGVSMWFFEGRDDRYPYVSNATADYVLAPIAILMGLAGLALAVRRASA